MVRVHNATVPTQLTKFQVHSVLSHETMTNTSCTPVHIELDVMHAKRSSCSSDNSLNWLIHVDSWFVRKGLILTSASKTHGAPLNYRFLDVEFFNTMIGSNWCNQEQSIYLGR